MKKIIIGSDHGGFRLKEKIRSFLEKKNFQVKDLGAYSIERCDYPPIAYRLAEEVSHGRYKQGILICKTGIGNSIVANRLSGVRAALCYNAKAARLSREHNDSNVLVLGSTFVKTDSAKRILNVWLNTKFSGGRHKRRLDQIKLMERKLRGNKR
ncbi:MAG: ribose 5-phosphate isomerase B [Candidatus Omnitrophica bacterium]|nr:ribose 5-phosphate isomerase B [Candidatus Omnitrophota bacterium]MDD5592706.1 ribose 5-phosphate isomerase B [Candidatus Omnitrophota bacterium]